MSRQVRLSELNRVAREKLIAALCAADAKDVSIDNADGNVVVTLAVPRTHPIIGDLPQAPDASASDGSVAASSPAIDSRILGRRGSSNRRAISRSPSPGRGPRTVQWASRLVDEVLSLAVKFRVHSSRNNIVSVPDLVRAIVVNRCGVAAIHRAAYSDLVATASKYREICPTCNAFFVFICSDEPSMLSKFMLFASMRQQLLPYITKESQRTVLASGEVQVVLRKYIALDVLSSVVKIVLRGNPRAPAIKTRLAAWLQTERKRSSLAFDFPQHVDAMELLLALLESSTAEPYFRSSPSVDSLLAKMSPLFGQSVGLDPSSGLVLIPERERESKRAERDEKGKVDTPRHVDPFTDRNSAMKFAVEAELARRRNTSRFLLSPPRPQQLLPIPTDDAQSDILDVGDTEADDNETWLMQQLSEGLRTHRHPEKESRRTALEEIAAS